MRTEKGQWIWQRGVIGNSAMNLSGGSGVEQGRRGLKRMESEGAVRATIANSYRIFPMSSGRQIELERLRSQETMNSIPTFTVGE